MSFLPWGAGSSGVPPVTANQATLLFCSFARIIHDFCNRQKSGHSHLLLYFICTPGYWVLFACLQQQQQLASQIQTHHARKHTHTHTYAHTCMATFDVSKRFTAACLELASFAQFDAGKVSEDWNSSPQKRSDGLCTISLTLQLSSSAALA